MADNMDMDEFDDDDGGGGLNTAVAVGVPMATAGVAVVAGLLVGVLGTWILMRGEPEKIEVPRDLNQEELAEACAPLLEKAINDLEQVEKKVQGLEGDVTAKSAEIAGLEEEMERRAKAGKLLAEERNALRAELEEKKKELEVLEKRLKIAIEEKELLTVELTQTKADLEEQKFQTHVAKEDALDYKWKDFIGGSQLEICERGNRKKLGRCRETVEEVLTPIKAQFEHCVRSGQAVPAVQEREKKKEWEEPLPEYSQWIDQENKISQGWYVMLCDPTLPEAPDHFALPKAETKAATAATGGDLLEEIEELDD